MEQNVPYIVYEGAQARHERTVKRLIVAIIIGVVLLFASNAIWLYAWAQYDYTSEETVIQQDGRGINLIGNDNEVNNNGAADDD